MFLIGAAVEIFLVPLKRFLVLAGFPSGQRDQTVNLTAMPSKVRILLPPPLKVVVFLDKRPVVLAIIRGYLRVWYNGRTSAFQADDAGSIPATRSTSA